ncbi:thiamine pyrophosphokinase [Syntrophobotulus glycolicus DSM 8271]|uniref:Thiamine diphosphokinase n=1 Tax=Syntrophobotulus glycolicus (strain DSM 8271 / FlGlyR) TaxID=645991 RepID=F0SUQ3_SYNGF|nr:thiamine diphosphokinase [Syntrophobotulus glycolicus]ADY56619.1 thiamine pyrophosphokinase [Syntrophobotulus glycolicus DSM 8271]
MRIAVLANGEWDIEWGRQEIAPGNIEVLICADGGGNAAISSGRLPDILVGDMDSIKEENLFICAQGKTKIKKYPAQKDETDLELAMEYAEEYLREYGKPKDEISLYGAGGKRLDHLMGNISMMLAFAERGRMVRMIEPSQEAWVLAPGEEMVKGTQGQVISIIPLSAEAVVDSYGLYYPLKNSTMYQHSPRGISNVLIEDEAKIKVAKGRILVVKSKVL